MSIVSNRRSLLARLAAAFLLSSSMTAASIAVAQAAAADPTSTREWGAFFRAGYGYCDAEALAKYWRMSTDDAKVNAGAKILRGDRRYLRQALVIAHRRHTCSSTFNYDDAVTVAEFWTGAPQN